MFAHDKTSGSRVKQKDSRQRKKTINLEPRFKQATKQLYAYEIKSFCSHIWTDM